MSCWRVASVGGARGSDVRACRAADSSPRCAKRVARSSRRGKSSVVLVVGLAGAPASASAARSRGSQSPRKKAVNLARLACFGTRSVPAGRESSMRRRKSQSFQARTASSEAKVGADGSGPVASRMKRSAKRSARRSWGLQKAGGVRNTPQGCNKTSLAEKGSKLAKAARSRGPCSVSESVCGEG